MPNNNPSHIVTGTCRASYCNLTQPKQSRSGGHPRYSVTLLLPKSDIATKQLIDTAIEAAAQSGMQKIWGGVRPPALPMPIHDGDGVRPGDGSPFGPECKGHWVFTASSRQQPGIVDANLQPILQPTEIYSGMYVRAGLTFFPYFQEGKKGIGCALDNVQKLADGEPLDGRATAQDDFGAAPQAPAYQVARPPVVNQPPMPAQPAYPPQAYSAQPPAYPQPAAAYDPITGQPVGGVYGI